MVHVCTSVLYELHSTVDCIAIWIGPVKQPEIEPLMSQYNFNFQVEFVWSKKYRQSRCECDHYMTKVGNSKESVTASMQMSIILFLFMFALE